jgi:hypothetical protein
MSCGYDNLSENELRAMLEDTSGKVSDLMKSNIRLALQDMQAGMKWHVNIDTGAIEMSEEAIAEAEAEAEKAKSEMHIYSVEQEETAENTKGGSAQ